MNVFRVQSLLRFFRLRLLPASILALLGFAVAPTHASAQSDVQTTIVPASILAVLRLTAHSNSSNL